MKLIWEGFKNMNKLEQKSRNRKYGKYPRRFYTSLDLAIIKHDEAVDNSKIKRGEKSRTNNQ